MMDQSPEVAQSDRKILLPSREILVAKEMTGPEKLLKAVRSVRTLRNEQVYEKADDIKLIEQIPDY